METITLTSTAFVDGQTIAKDYTGQGRDVSPPLAWSGVPASARELVIMLEDADGLAGNFSHWLAYGIDPKVTHLPEAIGPHFEIQHPKALQGKNSFLKVGYSGPMPGVGSGPHRYQFRIFAVDRPLGRAGGAFKEEVQKEMAGHVVAQGKLTGIYERKA